MCVPTRAHVRVRTHTLILFIFIMHSLLICLQSDGEILSLRRSTVFVTHLEILSLQYCDLVNDSQLLLLWLASRGTLAITNYYGDLVNATQ